MSRSRPARAAEEVLLRNDSSRARDAWAHLQLGQLIELGHARDVSPRAEGAHTLGHRGDVHRIPEITGRNSLAAARASLVPGHSNTVPGAPS
jgi:hypothetical protein